MGNRQFNREHDDHGSDGPVILHLMGALAVSMMMWVVIIALVWWIF